MNKPAQYYYSLPYRITIIPTVEGGYVAEIPQLPGCISQGETAQEAMEMIQDVKTAWIDTAMETGIEIPNPDIHNEDFSGKFNVRVPKSLHKTLVERAKEEHVSLNQFINYQLSRMVGYSANSSNKSPMIRERSEQEKN